jgi:hypothetical protein
MKKRRKNNEIPFSPLFWQPTEAIKTQNPAFGKAVVSELLCDYCYQIKNI